MTLLLKTYLNYTFHLLHFVLHDLPKNHKKLYPDLKTQKIVLEYKLQEANLMEKGHQKAPAHFYHRYFLSEHLEYGTWSSSKAMHQTP